MSRNDYSITHQTEHGVINLSVAPNEYLNATQIFISFCNNTNSEKHIIIKNFDKALYKYFSFWDAIIFRFSSPDAFQYNVKKLKFLVRPSIPHFTTDIYFIAPASDCAGFFVLTKLVEFSENRARNFLTQLLNNIDIEDSAPESAIQLISDAATFIGSIPGAFIGGVAKGITRTLINPSVVLLIAILVIAYVLLKRSKKI